MPHCYHHVKDFCSLFFVWGTAENINSLWQLSFKPKSELGKKLRFRFLVNELKKKILITADNLSLSHSLPRFKGFKWTSDKLFFAVVLVVVTLQSPSSHTLARLHYNEAMFSAVVIVIDVSKSVTPSHFFCGNVLSLDCSCCC